MTHVVGMPRLTSSAWLGPDKTATLAQGISSSTIWQSVNKVCSSTPFATFTIICPSFTKGAIIFAVERV